MGKKLNQRNGSVCVFSSFEIVLHYITYLQIKQSKMVKPSFLMVRCLNWAFSAPEDPRIGTWAYGTRRYQLKPLCGLLTGRHPLLMHQVCSKLVERET